MSPNPAAPTPAPIGALGVPTVRGLSNRRNALVLELTGTEGVAVYPGSVRYVHAGHFGYVIGVDRIGQADALRSHGAGIVVGDLAKLLDRP